LPNAGPNPPIGISLDGYPPSRMMPYDRADNRKHQMRADRYSVKGVNDGLYEDTVDPP